MSTPFGLRAPDNKKTVLMWVGVGVLALLVGLGVYYFWKTQQGNGATLGQTAAKPSAALAAHNANPRAHKAAAGKGGTFQPHARRVKPQFEQDRHTPQFAESMRAGFTSRLAGINDVGLPDRGCGSTAGGALGPDHGHGQRVEIHNLVPNSWRDPAYQAAEDPCTENLDTNWAAHAPTSKQFKTFIRASGIAAFGTSDHIINPTGRYDGLMRATNPPAPTSGRAHFMNDSEARQSALADTLGELDSVTDISCL